jgi:hypothetical protein
VAIVDSVLVTDTGAVAMTPPHDWPFKQLTVMGQTHNIPDVLLRLND